MKPKNTPLLIALFFTLVSAFWLINVRAAPQSAALRLPQADNPAPPAAPVRLVFVHHSTGGNWLADVGEHESAGGLGRALMNNNYYVSATNYGWTVEDDTIGDRTDLGHWWEWFNGPTRDAILAALYAENEQNFGDFGAWPRLASAPGGENEIILFKSCFPNSHLGGNPDDPPTSGENPLRGQDAWSEHMTVGNAKRIYVDLLTYFATRQDKLFIVITAPPLLEDDLYRPTDPAHAANARAFNQWLVNDWLDGYSYPNVAVFDFYHVLTSNGGDPTTNDLDAETGNHHRWWNGAVQHIQGVSGDFSAYALWRDSHPTSAGGQKATGEFVPLLNVFYHRWADGGGTPVPTLTPTFTPTGGTPVPTLTPTLTPPSPDDPHSLFLPLVLRDSAAPPAASLWVTDDSVRLDPVTGSLIEERHSAGAIGADYHTTNPVWDGQTVRLMAARNEVVAFQVMVADGPHTGVALTVSDLTGPTTLPAANHVRRFKEWFIQVTAESDFCEFAGETYVETLGLGWYPDPLIPLDEPGPPSAGYGQPFNIPDAQNAIPGQTAAAFWVDVLVPESAPPGVYTGSVAVTVDGNTTTLPLMLEVRQLTLPAENHAGLGSVNYGGLNFSVLWANYPARNDAGLQRWFQMAHAHRLELDAHWLWPLCADGSLGTPCADPDWEMWGDIWRPYMTGSAFTPAEGYWGPSPGQPIRRFMLPQDFNWPAGDEDGDLRPDDEAAWQASLRAVEGVLIAEGWTDIEAQLWFHPTDEPRSLEQFQLLDDFGNLVDAAGLVDRDHITHRADLGIFTNIGDFIPGWTVETIFDGDGAAFDGLGDDIDTWNVLASHFSMGVDEMAARLAANPDEQGWFYTSCCAGEPAVGAPYLEGEALGMRTWGWIVYRYQLQGGVTWEMDAGFTNLPGCWTDPMCSGYGINGDATLFYAGWTIGLPDDQPVASIRLKNLRRGSQDYEYLWLLAAADGNDARAAALAASVVPQALDDGLEPYVATPPGLWAHTPFSYEDARRQIADWLEAAGFPEIQ